MPRGRLELPRHSALPPQDSVSTNSTTWAQPVLYSKAPCLASVFFHSGKILRSETRRQPPVLFFPPGTALAECCRQLCARIRRDRGKRQAKRRPLKSSAVVGNFSASGLSRQTTLSPPCPNSRSSGMPLRNAQPVQTRFRRAMRQKTMMHSQRIFRLRKLPHLAFPGLHPRYARVRSRHHGRLAG